MKKKEATFFLLHLGDGASEVEDRELTDKVTEIQEMCGLNSVRDIAVLLAER